MSSLQANSLPSMRMSTIHNPCHLSGIFFFCCLGFFVVSRQWVVNCLQFYMHLRLTMLLQYYKESKKQTKTPQPSTSTPNNKNNHFKTTEISADMERFSSHHTTATPCFIHRHTGMTCFPFTYKMEFTKP